MSSPRSLHPSGRDHLSVSVSNLSVMPNTLAASCRSTSVSMNNLTSNEMFNLEPFLESSSLPPRRKCSPAVWFERLILSMRWQNTASGTNNWRHRLGRVLHCFRIVLAHLFSTTGLCFLVVSYVLLGALVFGSLEGAAEERRIQRCRERLETGRQQLAEDMWSFNNQIYVFYPDEWKKQAVLKIKDFQQEMFHLLLEVKDGSKGPLDYADEHVFTNQWSMSGALLYSVTVITTIGYGNVTCKTDLGRLATIIYAVLGIPITFLCLANLGNLMAKAFRFSYRRLCCSCCYLFECETPKRRRKRKLKQKQKQRRGRHASPGVVITNAEDCSTQMNCVTKQAEQLDESIEKIEVPSMIDGKAEFEVEELETSGGATDDEGGKIDGENDDDDPSKRVPISLVFCLIFGYITLGGFMFSFWEGWRFMEGAYFCFITLTTIGFGDLVPGSATFSPESSDQIKFIICCVYMLVGLSLIAMSFNLVQEEIVVKFRRLGRWLRLLPTSTKTNSTMSQKMITKTANKPSNHVEVVYV